MSSPRNILIIRLSSLGDIIHALPAFQSLRESFPQSRIDWLIERRTAFMLEAVAGIDEVRLMDTRALRLHPRDRHSWSEFRRALGQLRTGRYDVVIDFQGLLKTGLISFWTGAPVRIGFSRLLVRERPAHWFYNCRLPEQPRPLHVIELNGLLAGLAGATVPPGRIVFKSDPGDIQAVTEILARERLSRFAVINPGGGWPTKLWPAAKYGALADGMRRELELQVAVTTGPGEEMLFEEIARTCIGPPPTHLQIRFLQLIPLLARARLLVGGDTGPFHLACALGTPVVGIFGPTSPRRNGPFLVRSEVVCHELPCSHCYGRACPTQLECMDIAVEEVLGAAARCLGK
jgi:heptosyltransferase-1